MLDDFKISTKVHPDYDIKDQINDFIAAYSNVAQDIGFMYFGKKLFYLRCKICCEELGIMKDELIDSYNYLPCNVNYDVQDVIWDHLYRLKCEHGKLTDWLTALSNKYNVIFELRINDIIIYEGWSSNELIKKYNE